MNQEVLLLLTTKSRHGCQTAFQVCTGTICGIAFEKIETSSLFYVSEWDIFAFLTELFQFSARLWKLNFMCHEEIFWAIFFSLKIVSYQNCFETLGKKTFRILKKISAGLAILHPISFDKNSDMSFWRESTVMKVSSFEEKEQKTISFYSKSPPFFLKTTFCFSRVSFAFYWNKFQTHN